jgi:CRP-like cAMP-binding protein
MSAFKRTNLSALSALADQMVERRAAAGSELFRAGDTPKITFFVIRGTVECETPDGRAFGFGPGTAVGGVEAIAGKPRWYTARASSDLVMLEGRASHLLDMIEDNFEMGMDFVGALVGGLQGILAAKAAMGVAAFAAKRDVSNLGAVPVGA